MPTGNMARHLATLAALISGIVSSQSIQLPTIAAHVPDGAQPESRVKRFARWVGNPTITEEPYFVPYAQVLLGHLALQTLVLVIDGTTLQHTMQDYGWSYGVRTGSHLTVMWDGDSFRCETVASCIKPGTLVELREACVTEAAYGPLMLLCCWAKGDKAPLSLLTYMASADETCRVYTKRFRIETFCSDQKSRGFHIHKAHLSDPRRLARLLMAACFAYIWIICLGALCEQDGWVRIIHRGDRCDSVCSSADCDCLTTC